MIKKTILLLTGLTLIFGMTLTGCFKETPTQKVNPLLLTYANIAIANYTDVLHDAEKLQNAIDKFAASPTEMTLKAAKDAWLIARESYGTSEVFRLSGGPIDAENGWVAKEYGSPESQLNAWPLDENMIDYTIDAKGHKTSGNIIDTKGVFNPGGEDSVAVDVTNITVEAITALNENGGDANVATGYHAVEFLLWGQDQDYSSFIKDSVTHGAMSAGKRPLSDFTTDANAPRRLAYLKAAAAKIVSDLTPVVAAWSRDNDKNYRAALLGKNVDKSKNIDSKKALRTILAAMGVFIKSEIANERIAIAVLTPSEEDEHSCFSDNTHRDIAVDYQGFKNVLMGRYKGVDYGAAPVDAMKEDAKSELMTLLSKIEKKIASIDSIAKTSRHFDYQIQPNDPQARVIVKLKNELRKLGDKMVTIAAANGINLSKDDVTNAEETKL